MLITEISMINILLIFCVAFCTIKFLKIKPKCSQKFHIDTQRNKHYVKKTFKCNNSILTTSIL